MGERIAAEILDSLEPDEILDLIIARQERKLNELYHLREVMNLQTEARTPTPKYKAVEKKLTEAKDEPKFNKITSPFAQPRHGVFRTSKLLDKVVAFLAKVECATEREIAAGTGGSTTYLHDKVLKSPFVEAAGDGYRLSKAGQARLAEMEAQLSGAVS